MVVKIYLEVNGLVKINIKTFFPFWQFSYSNIFKTFQTFPIQHDCEFCMTFHVLYVFNLFENYWNNLNKIYLCHALIKILPIMYLVLLLLCIGICDCSFGFFFAMNDVCHYSQDNNHICHHLMAFQYFLNIIMLNFIYHGIISCDSTIIVI